MQQGAFLESASTKHGILPADEVAKEKVLTREQLMEFSIPR